MPQRPKKNKKANNKKVATDLQSFLQSVYHDTVSLETTCNHRCECCKVAMPQLNYCEFVQVITVLWEKLDNNGKLALLLKSLEYFFRNDYKKWSMDSLIKPCMLLDNEGLCTIYKDRPLNCRMYGLWPKEIYEKRVERFQKAYEPLGLNRKDLPLHEQCPYVKRVDETVPLTVEVIEGLFSQLDKMDAKLGGFSKLQILQKENYRTFHDWLLLKVLGEDWLVKLTAFCMAASQEVMQSQIETIQTVWTAKFTKDGMPDITRAL